MKRFYLTGHRTFGNRGCEAIVRTTVGLLREQLGEVEVLVPSSDIVSDKKHWPEAVNVGVQFVPAYSPRMIVRFWRRLQRLPLPFLRRTIWPFPMPRWFKKILESVDCVFSVGGDLYSLDYGIPSLIMAMDRWAIDLGKPVILWGASVGPFEREPHLLPVIIKHLGRMSFIVARESVTFEYLTSLGLGENVILGADPAWALLPEPCDLTPFWPKDSGEGVLGINISPLLLRYRSIREPAEKLLDEIAQFIRYVVVKRGLGVLLVPHVIPHDRSAFNNDAAFMAKLFTCREVKDLGEYVRLMDDHLNAPQTKYVISNCRFFIGARTHSTIAALSSGVPTISIAYSVKAKGINRDVFGNDRYVLDAPYISKELLIQRLTRLWNEERDIRHLCAAARDNMIGRARDALRRILKGLHF